MTPSQSATADLPIPRADPAWDEAFLRVESYIRAHGLESRVLLNQITAEIIQEARGRIGAGCGDEPVALAMQITHARIGMWFAQAGQGIDWANERMRAQGRLAMIIADLPGRWPDYFLSPDPMPPDLVAAIASYQLLPGPELRLSNMPPAPLEFGHLESDDPRPPARGLAPPARALAAWLLIVGFFGIAWAASH